MTITMSVRRISVPTGINNDLEMPTPCRMAPVRLEIAQAGFILLIRHYLEWRIPSRHRHIDTETDAGLPVSDGRFYLPMPYYWRYFLTPELI